MIGHLDPRAPVALTSAAEIRHLVGDINDATLLAIPMIGACAGEWEVAARYLSGYGKLDRADHALSGKVTHNPRSPGPRGVPDQ